MEKPPLISLGISCFNAEDTITRAIESALAQEWPNLEILIVDDCSSDRSVEIIQKFEKRDSRVKFHRHKRNQGLAGAINTIAKHARGEYVALFDDDDESHPSRIKKQYLRLVNFEAIHPSRPVVCYSNRRVLNNGTEETRVAIGREQPEPHGSMVADYLLWLKMTRGYVWGAFASCTMMVSKKVLKDFPFDTNFRRSAEWDFAVRVALDGGYFIATNEYLIVQHLNESPEKGGRVPLENHLRLIRKHGGYLRRRYTYWGAILFVYARFYRSRSIAKCLFFMGLACLISPKILASVIVISIRGFDNSRIS